MSRMILDELDCAGIGIASGTDNIVGLPPVKVDLTPSVSGTQQAVPARR